MLLNEFIAETIAEVGISWLDIFSHFSTDKLQI
jgi:hypothetical protein